MTPTDTVVSEERLRSLLEAISADVLEGDNRLYTSAHVTLPMKADSLCSAITELLDRRTATPQSGGVVALPAWNDLPEAVRSAGVEEGMIWVSQVGADAALSIYNAMRAAKPTGSALPTRAIAASPLTEEQPAAKFKRGDRVQKTKGSAWRGHVVGTYSTSLTPEGYNVESENEPGSVQLYPAAALETLPRSTTGGAK